jgi:Fe-S-cluster containining protein
MPASSVPIVLAIGGELVPIRPDHVYFAFASGRLGYDCVSCGAKCCRAHGYEVLVGRELQQQLATHHALRFFLDPCETGADQHFHARNFNPACFFLDGQGRCDLHVNHGFDAKPETCRLFPFNDLHRVGDFLIVAPHPKLCPLAVLPPGELSDASDHDDLLAMMCASGIGTHVLETAANGTDVPAVVALERRICEMAEQQTHATRYATFAAEQLAVSRKDAADDGRQRAAKDVDVFLATVHDVLREHPPAGDDDPTLLRTMVGITPAIRARIVFGYGEIPGPADLERVPYLLLALYTFAGLARQAGMGAVTYQTVMGLFDTYRPLLMVLADVNRVMVSNASATMDVTLSGNRHWQERAIAVAAALSPSTQHIAQASLGQILCEHADASGLERILFLKRLTRQWNGCLVPMIAATSAKRHE